MKEIKNNMFIFYSVNENSQEPQNVCIDTKETKTSLKSFKSKVTYDISQIMDSN